MIRLIKLINSLSSPDQKKKNKIMSSRFFYHLKILSPREIIVFSKEWNTLSHSSRAHFCPIANCLRYNILHIKPYQKTAWRVFSDNFALLNNLTVGNFTDYTCKSAEKFVCRKYNIDQTDSIDEAQQLMFSSLQT